MTKKERIALKNECERWFDYTHDIFTYAMDELEHKKPVKQIITALTQKEKALDNEFPTGWFNHMVDSFVLGAAYTDTAILKKLRRKAEEDHNGRVKEIFDIWTNTPMRWSPFDIEEHLGEDLYTIYDFEEEKQELLYSPAITTFLRSPENRGKLQIVLRGYTGSCWITYGAFHDYFLSPFDLAQWATLLDKTTYESKGITSCIQKNFLDFFALDEIMLTPFISHRGETIRNCIRIFNGVDLDETALPGSWDRTTEGPQLVQLQFSGISESEQNSIKVPKKDLQRLKKTIEDYWTTEGIRIPTIYYHKRRHELILTSLTASGYDLLYRLLKSSQSNFDPNGTGFLPEWSIPASLNSLIDRQEHIKTPWQDLIEPFIHIPMEYDESLDDETSDGDSSKPPADMEAMNIVLKEIQEAHNSGRPFDKQAVSEKSGLDIETISSLYNNFSKMMKKYDFEVKIPPSDIASILPCVEPSPNMKRLFRESLYSSELFYVQDDDGVRASFEVLTGGKYSAQVDSMGLRGVISDLFLQAFNRQDATVMNSLFYLFSEYGQTWVPARSYAVTLAKWFGQLILPTLDLGYDGFIEYVSTFILRKLCTHAICEVQARPSREERANGTYGIKTTIFFEDFIELQKPLS